MYVGIDKMKKKNKIKLNKKRTIIIIGIALLLVMICICGYLFYNSKKLRVSLVNDREVNINEEVYNTDYIKGIKNGNIISDKELVDTSILGKKKVKIEIKNYFNKIKDYVYEIIIVDKEEPSIEYSDKLSTNVGTEINLLEGVKASDNSNEDIEVIIEGEYDFNKEGTYELYYVAKDSSGNEKREKFMLEVIKKKETIQNSSNDSITYFTTSKGFKGHTKNGITYIDGILVVNKTYSISSNYYPGDLTSETRSNMNNMFADAKAIGLNIYLSSGFRSYNSQNYIYNDYVSRDGKEMADTYSARAGHSEHQTGLAFDVNQINDTFIGTPEANWLSANCWKYGFILRYPEGKTNETGYKYESWHFRYVGTDLAKKLYNDGDWITLESYFGITSQYNY